MAETALGWISLAALAVVIVASCFTRLNPGILSIVLAAVVGGWLAPRFGRAIGLKAVLAGFPSDLFLTLAAVTLLFTKAEINGTLDRVASAAVRCCRGNAGWMPVAFFLLSFGIASIGPGAIAATALLIPPAMITARRAGIPPFLMAILVSHAALGGGMSPMAPTGLIADGLMEDRLGLPGFEWK
jgi:MFS family permease